MGTFIISLIPALDITLILWLITEHYFDHPTKPRPLYQVLPTRVRIRSDGVWLAPDGYPIVIPYCHSVFRLRQVDEENTNAGCDYLPTEYRFAYFYHIRPDAPMEYIGSECIYAYSLEGAKIKHYELMKIHQQIGICNRYC